MSATAVPVEPDDDEGAGAIGLPIVMMIALAVLLFLPDQIKELYRIYAEAWLGQSWRNPQLIIAAGSMVALTLFIWRLARELTRLPAAQRIIPDRWAKLVSDWTPRLVCLLPWAGIATGIWMSLPPSTDSPPPEFREFYPNLQSLHDLLMLGLKVCGAIALGLFLIVTITELIFARWGKRPFGRPFLVRLWPVYAAIILGVSAAGFVLDGAWFVYVGVIPILVVCSSPSPGCSPICGFIRNGSGRSSWPP
ncbi:MAG: hypothetical protein HC868_07585 [Sphingomonadales bacterium]|nr:hypothetical protein [Sphingomonadales bacterium]